MDGTVLFLFGAFMGIGAVLSWLAFRSEWWRDNGWLHLAVILFVFAPFTFTITRLSGDALMANPVGTMPSYYALWVAVAIAWVVFLTSAAVHLVMDTLPRIGMGYHLLKVEPTYDRADAAEKGKDWETAARIYAEAIAERPGDVEARMRLAEVRLQQGRPREAAAALEDALPHTKELSRRGAVAYRLSEILAGACGDPEAALEPLERLVREHPHTKEAHYALDRLGPLKGRRTRG